MASYMAARLPRLAFEKLNLQRKVQHIGTGLALAQIFLLFSQQTCTLALGAGTISLASLQVARMLSNTVNVEFLRFFGSMLKEEERIGVRPPAALWFLMGLFLCLVAFPRRLTLLCTLVATLADPLAAIGGILLGGPQLLPRGCPSSKSLGGSMTCFLVAALLGAGVVLTAPRPAPAADAVVLGVLCGACAAACEIAGGLSRYVDDNILTSFGSGLLLQVAASCARLAGWQNDGFRALLS
ncbi:unnamed protein product [Effrenium voratum]|nr:unnamed protein product [Effrenium voratum]